MVFGDMKHSSFLTVALLSLGSLITISAKPDPAPTPDDVNDEKHILSIRGDENSPKIIKVDFGIPNNTVVSGLLGVGDTDGKPATVSVEFDMNQPDTFKTPADGWFLKEFNWKIYNPLLAIKDENVLFDMKCSVNIKGAQKFNTNPPTFRIFAQEPYISPTGDETWDRIKGEAYVVCPDGGCKAKNGCGSVKDPKWTKDFIDGWKY